VYVLSNGDKPYVYGCVPNGELGISVIVAGQGDINVDGRWVRQSSVGIYGLVSRVQFHRMSPGYREINIGFKPEYLQLFLRERISNLLRRQSTDLIDLINKNSVDELYDSLQATKSDDEILSVVGKFLCCHLISETIEKRVSYCLGTIRGCQLRNVESLSRHLNLSSATLRNLFRQHVGISPKELFRIHRIKSALKNMKSDEESFTQAAYSLGYYDQSHFIHEFREAIGLTPKQYFQNKDLIFDFYNYQRWSLDSFGGIII
jgi:AraC-like DNA-binding protein